MFVTALVGLLVSTALAEITKGTSRRLFEPIFRKLKYYVGITGHFWIVEFYVVAGGSDSVLFDRIHNGIVHTCPVFCFLSFPLTTERI